MIKYLVPFLVLANVLFAENTPVKEENITPKVEQVLEQAYNPNVDCLILEDENSIICKFEVIRDIKDQNIVIHWISPTGEISRTREMLIPAGDVSAYDYRYLDGREGGKWNFRVVYNNNEYTSQFELK
ncbi:MAG: hypothetical protein KA040_01310 [Aliarcobacter sp.]|jgi:hypothetical protein|nr:hypothetical protein [Aliarcobacter sp.]